MKKTILLTAIILVFAAGIARADNAAKSKIMFEIPRYAGVNWFPDEDKDGDKKHKKDRKSSNASEAREYDEMEITSNCETKIIVNKGGNETEYSFGADIDNAAAMDKMWSEIQEDALDEAAGRTDSIGAQYSGKRTVTLTLFMDN